MKRILSIGVVAAGIALVPGAPAYAEGDAAKGRVKAITCMGCHGIPGYHNAYPNYPVPRVGGQHQEYIVIALKAYRSGKRGHKTMQAQAASLSEQDMLDIAAYFASAAGE